MKKNSKIGPSTPPLNFFFISEMTHSSGLGGLSDTVHVKKMPHIPKKVVGGFFRKLKISFLINESKLSLYFTLFKGVFKYLISIHHALPMHAPSTGRAHSVHASCRPCARPVHALCTPRAHPVHALCTLCARPLNGQ